MSWLLPWETSWTFLVLFAGTCYCYWRGALPVATEAPREWLFVIGMVSLYVVGQTHFEYFSEHAFFMHRLQHLVLHHVAPFLLVLSRPGERLRAGSPLWLRRLLNHSARAALELLSPLWCSPWLAAGLFVGVVLLWLTPDIHLIAMLDWRWYRVMNISVFVTGLMFWNLTLPPAPGQRPRLSLGARMLMLVAVILPQVVLGAVLFFAPASLYPVYSLCGRAFNHLSELADQQLGALILWIPGSMMSVVAAVLVMRHELAAHRPGSAVIPSVRGAAP